MPDESPILVSRGDGIAVISLNRPNKLNALDFEMAEALAAAFGAVAADPAVRAVVLRGNGRAFMAGGDLACFLADPARAPDVAAALVGAFHQAMRLLAEIDKPVLASVQGAAAGGGMSLAMACDLVIAADNAKLVFAYSQIGTVPDGGLSYRLPRLVGPRKAMEIALLSEPIGAAEALRLGLVSKVVAAEALEAETMALAARLAQVPAPACARTKALLRQSWDADFDRQLDSERAAFVACAATPEFHQRVGAFLKR